MKDFQIISEAAERSLHHVKMDRRHLRAKDGICITHFLCKHNTVVRTGNDLSGVSSFISYTKGRNQGTDTDARSAQVVYLIDFQHSIDLTGIRQNITDLVGSNRIKTAAERVQLDQVQIVLCFYKTCSCIQSGVIHPLVSHDGRTFDRSQVGNSILC